MLHFSTGQVQIKHMYMWAWLLVKARRGLEEEGEHLCSKHEALHSNPSTTKDKKKKNFFHQKKK
jgi:hypothetical protein